MNHTRTASTIALAVAALSLVFPTAGHAQAVAADTTKFVVLGHLRGTDNREFNLLLPEVIEEVARIRPDFVVLTGDQIWGDPRAALDDKSVVEVEYARLDSALAQLGVPILAVPGNHEITDQGTHDLFVERYGDQPRAVDIGSVRAILVNTAWRPERGPRTPELYGGFQMEGTQLAGIEAALEDVPDGLEPFVFMHHLHFWQEDRDAWWTDAHPILATGGVRAVFAGDYGPQKFSYMNRDGIHYYQSAIAPQPPIEILLGHEWNRLLAQQFDNFLSVTVAGGDVDITVHAVGEISTRHFTPARWREQWGGLTRPPLPGGFERLSLFLETGKAKVFTAGVLGMMLFFGCALGWLVARRFS